MHDYMQKVFIQLFSVPLWLNSWADWLCKLGMATSLGEKTVNSNLLNST